MSEAAKKKAPKAAKKDAESEKLVEPPKMKTVYKGVDDIFPPEHRRAAVKAILLLVYVGLFVWNVVVTLDRNFTEVDNVFTTTCWMSLVAFSGGLVIADLLFGSRKVRPWTPGMKIYHCFWVFHSIGSWLMYVFFVHGLPRNSYPKGPLTTFLALDYVEKPLQNLPPVSAADLQKFSATLAVATFALIAYFLWSLEDRAKLFGLTKEVPVEEEKPLAT
jgi:hypothetical protein